MRALLLLALLAGCPLQGKTSSTLTGGSSQPASSSSREDDRVVAKPDPSAPRYIEREQFHQLKGLTVEQATAKAKSFGHDGKVKVEEMDEFIEGCKPGTVCTATDERGSQIGMNVHDTLLLQTTKSLSIAPPPSGDD